MKKIIVVASISFSIFLLGSSTLTLAEQLQIAKAALAQPEDYVPLEQVMIPSQFETVEVNSNNFADELGKCLHKVDQNLPDFKKIQEMGFGAFEHPGSGNLFLITRTTAICLTRSSEKRFIFAAESFQGTVTPEGVPEKILDGWYKEISKTIASKGSAEIIYALNDGSAHLVRYWARSFSLEYWTESRGKGEWENEKVDLHFSHPSLSSVVAKKTEYGRSATWKLFPIAHRLENAQP